MKRLLERRERVLAKPRSLLDLIGPEDREAIERTMNLLVAMEEGMTMHKGCARGTCPIYSDDAMAMLDDHASFLRELIDGYDTSDETAMIIGSSFDSVKDGGHFNA